MDDKKQVGKLFRHIYNDGFGNRELGDFDIDFGGCRVYGKLEVGKEFEILHNGVWIKTALGYNEYYDQFYLERIGYIEALGMTVRI